MFVGYFSFRFLACSMSFTTPLLVSSEYSAITDSNSSKEALVSAYLITSTFSAINTSPSFVQPHTEHLFLVRYSLFLRRFLLCPLQRNPSDFTGTVIIHNNTGGFSGPALLPIAVRMVWQTYGKVKIPIVGLGGISTWQDAVEMLLAGTTALQIGTVFFTDPYAPIKITEGLSEYMDKNGVKSLSELTGAMRPW